MKGDGMTFNEIQSALERWSLSPTELQYRDCGCRFSCDHWSYVVESRIEGVSLFIDFPYHPDSHPHFKVMGVRFVAHLRSRRNPEQLLGAWEKLGLKSTAELTTLPFPMQDTGEFMSDDEEPRLEISLHHEFQKGHELEGFIDDFGCFLAEVLILISLKRESFFDVSNVKSADDAMFDGSEIVEFLSRNGAADLEILCNLFGSPYAVLRELLCDPETYLRLNTTPSNWRLRI